MRTAIIALVIAAALAGPWSASRVVAQVGRAAMGTAVGVGGGAVITISVIVARARFQNVYLASVEDLIHWQSLPMILTPAVGAAFGFASREAFIGSVIGSTSGMLIGTAVGAGVGWLVSPQAAAPWAGGAIGAGAGMTVGGLFLGIRGWLESREDEDGGDPLRFEVRLPI
jgi:hypothetical protein